MTKENIQLKQRAIFDNEVVTLDGVMFTIDNAGENDILLSVGSGNVSKTIAAGEQFIISNVQNCRFVNQQFNVRFVGSGAKKVLIWYADYTDEQNKHC
jgi:hypothetical protein